MSIKGHWIVGAHSAPPYCTPTVDALQLATIQFATFASPYTTCTYNSPLFNSPPYNSPPYYSQPLHLRTFVFPHYYTYFATQYILPPFNLNTIKFFDSYIFPLPFEVRFTCIRLVYLMYFAKKIITPCWKKSPNPDLRVYTNASPIITLQELKLPKETGDE
jgi:hypothetical protein